MVMEFKIRWEARKALIFGAAILVLTLVCYGVAFYTTGYGGVRITVNQVEEMAVRYFRSVFGRMDFLDALQASGLKVFLRALAVVIRRYVLALGLLELFIGLYLKIQIVAQDNLNACSRGIGPNWETTRCPHCGKRFAGRPAFCPNCTMAIAVPGPAAYAVTTHPRLQTKANPASRNVVKLPPVEHPAAPAQPQFTFCPDCGRKNPAGAKFCAGCGRQL